MALPEQVIADWARRVGNREELREIPLMFAVKPDPSLIDEYADDAVKASRYALEATLRLLLTSFEERLKTDAMTVPILVPAEKGQPIARSRRARRPCPRRALAAPFGKQR
jgi:hypothetical protein